MMRCQGCRCTSERGPGWVAMLARDVEDGGAASVVLFCPPCAADALGYESRAAYD